FFSSRRRHTRFSRDWSSDVCSSDLNLPEPFIVAPGNRIPRCDLLRKYLELFDQDRRLHGIDAARETQPHVIVLVGPLTMHANAEIGRASCRERVKSSGVIVTVQRTR